jgi:hypothetical protein
MDFIADYIAGGSSVISRLTYTSSGLLSDQWKKTLSLRTILRRTCGTKRRRWN